MSDNFFKGILYKTIFFILIFSSSLAETYNNINVTGNSRISTETIILFSGIKNDDLIDEKSTNQILKNLYKTNFFSDVSVIFKKKILQIQVVENPIIENLNYDGVKANKIKDNITEDLNLRPRSSYNEILLKKDRQIIIERLKILGYYFSKIDTFIETLNDNKINLTYQIDVGKKSKIKKISFIGDKKFKSGKLRNIIISEEYKFWKFLSGKKFLNESLINFDIRLLKSFYLNNGYYNVTINQSYAKLLNDGDFELIYNIEANEKIYFNEISLDLPTDFEKNNYSEITNLFKKIKDKHYSINLIEEILEKIETITVNEQNLSVSAIVEENIVSNKINLNFIVKESEKFIVEKINIYGNNVTRENVIRNQFELDEGDFFNEILNKRSINNIKNLNFFKKVQSKVIDGKEINSKIINLTVDEKPTGEISAGAGVGTSGGTVSFGVRENNYLGKGLSVDSNITLEEDSIRGLLSLSNPNYKNSDKSLYGTLQRNEDDKIKDFGYKSSKTGFSIGTRFEYLDDTYLALSSSAFFEDIETNSTASARQKKQAGDYFDTFLNFDIDYDKRNQKFKTSDGFRSIYKLNLPLISDTNTITNSYEYRYYNEFFENSISQLSFLVKGAKSLSDEIKLSERIFIPSNRLRGFERGKVGPKDGKDFIGGNFITTLNLSSNIPIILEDTEEIDLSIFFDAANIWGVDYDSSIDDTSGIRSSVGISIDWWTPIGPLNFSLAHPITEKQTDITQTFRFNIGTTF